MRHFQSAVLAVSIIFLASQASAQDCRQDRTEFDAAIQQAESDLGALEKLMARVLQTGSLTREDGTQADALMGSYANSMYRGYQISSEAASAASDSAGERGDVLMLREFENLAKAHEGRLIAFALSSEKLDADVTQGKIREQASLTPSQEQSPVQQLTQEGQQQLAMRPGFMRIVNEGVEQQNSFGARCQAAAGALGNLLIPTAEAAQIAPCVNPCWNKRWSECWQCIRNAGPQVVAAWNEFWSCWNASTKWWKRAWCLVRFIAKVA
jgi:hypothetical protein